MLCNPLFQKSSPLHHSILWVVTLPSQTCVNQISEQSLLISRFIELKNITKPTQPFGTLPSFLLEQQISVYKFNLTLFQPLLSTHKRLAPNHPWEMATKIKYPARIWRSQSSCQYQKSKCADVFLEELLIRIQNRVVRQRTSTTSAFGHFSTAGEKRAVLTIHEFQCPPR